MTTYALAIARMHQDLRAAGVSEAAAIATVFSYIGALEERSNSAWKTFYRSVYERLCELAAQEYPYAGKAAEPLLRLLDDDFGQNLISAHERARIRARLVEDGSREASLSS
jgi:hypothetical protein